MSTTVEHLQKQAEAAQVKADKVAREAQAAAQKAEDERAARILAHDRKRRDAFGDPAKVTEDLERAAERFHQAFAESSFGRAYIDWVRARRVALDLHGELHTRFPDDPRLRGSLDLGREVGLQTAFRYMEQVAATEAAAEFDRILAEREAAGEAS